MNTVTVRLPGPAAVLAITGLTSAIVAVGLLAGWRWALLAAGVLGVILALFCSEIEFGPTRPQAEAQALLHAVPIRKDGPQGKKEKV